MLKPAIEYKEELQQKLQEVYYKNKQNLSYFDTNYDLALIGGGIKIEKNTMKKQQFVSIKDGEIVGYISYNISLPNYRVYNFQIISFGNNTLTFGIDLKRSWERIFEVYKFRKINFSVFVGNPIEKSYDRLMESLGGRIVGVQKQHCKLADGKFYDQKLYEVLRDDYLSARKKDKRK